jgi:RNA polymerase sigma-70 factor (ECF subfamily)
MSAGNSAQTNQLLDQLRAGDQEAADRLFALYHPELLAFIGKRMNPKLRRRLGASDVVQETLVEASRRLENYLAEPAMPFHLWLQQIARDRLIMERRRHQAGRRNVDREVPLPDSCGPTPANRLVDPASTPGQHVARQEIENQVRQAIEQMPENDRTILQMRYLQELPNQEAAAALGIDPVAASQRYGRALRKLQKLLKQGPREKSP